MKRLFLLLVTGFTAIPLLAQLSGDGYYRIQNTGSKRYLTISNDRVDDTNKNAIKSGNEGAIYGMKTINDPICDPSSIIYITKETANQPNYNIQGQGINPLQVLKNNNAVFRIVQDGNSYVLYGAREGIALFLVDNNGSDGFIKIARKGAYPSHQNWTITPIDGITQYLGISPDLDIKVGDKYYTTIYASFPFELPEGMKAYYVCNYAIGTGIDRAELKEITGKVPAKTPVILECSSRMASDNKLSLSPSGTSAITDNKLSGVFFCYIKMKATDPTKENTSAAYTAIKNAVEYDASTMRVLGLVDGELALVKASDEQLVVTDQGKYLPANKAYFKFTGAADDNILLLNKDNYEEASKLISFEKVVYKKDETNKSAVLINGRKISGNCEIPETITQADGTIYTVNAIASDAFKDNHVLTQVCIPQTVVSIGEGSFAGCTNLKDIYVYSENPIDITKSPSVFDGVDFNNCILHIPDGCLEEYVNDAIWGLFKNIVTAGINNIVMDEKTSDIYNLRGQKVLRQGNLPQGVYIIKGKKVIKN